MAQLYQQICHLFIRPARQQYNLYDLGNPILQSKARRVDFELTNPRGFALKCSYYQPLHNNNASQSNNSASAPPACILYLHSLNGSRLESTKLVPLILQRGMTFANFDFSGCGTSQGQYVSLGYHEKHDVLKVIEHLNKKYGICKFGLWGRSMGAVTALKFCEMIADQKDSRREWSIHGLALDSPFSSLNQLAIEIAEQKVSIPSILLKAVFMIIKNTIQEKANFKTQELEMTKNIDKVKIPVMILASQEDTVINCKHSERLYDAYPVPQKQLIYVKGNHNACRDNQQTQRVISFMKRQLDINGGAISVRGTINRSKQSLSASKAQTTPLSAKSQTMGRNNYHPSSNGGSHSNGNSFRFGINLIENNTDNHDQVKQTVQVRQCSVSPVRKATVVGGNVKIHLTQSLQSTPVPHPVFQGGISMMTNSAEFFRKAATMVEDYSTGCYYVSNQPVQVNTSSQNVVGYSEYMRQTTTVSAGTGSKSNNYALQKFETEGSSHDKVYRATQHEMNHPRIPKFVIANSQFSPINDYYPHYSKRIPIEHSNNSQSHSNGALHVVQQQNYHPAALANNRNKSSFAVPKPEELVIRLGNSSQNQLRQQPNTVSSHQSIAAQNPHLVQSSQQLTTSHMNIITEKLNNMKKNHQQAKKKTNNNTGSPLEQESSFDYVRTQESEPSSAHRQNTSRTSSKVMTRRFNATLKPGQLEQALREKLATSRINPQLSEKCIMQQRQPHFRISSDEEESKINPPKETVSRPAGRENSANNNHHRNPSLLKNTKKPDLLRKSNDVVAGEGVLVAEARHTVINLKAVQSFSTKLII